MDNILSEIEGIFRDLFDEEDITLTEQTSAADIDDWDSITHVQLLVLIEKHYNITFTSKEIQQFKTVGDIVNCIKNK